MPTADLAERARAVLDTVRYVVLGTVDPDGTPRTSPVFFTHDGYRDLYWVSRPGTHHSGNLAERPRVSAVVFDSTVRVGEAQAVSTLTRTAAEVAEADLADACRVAFADVAPGRRRSRLLSSPAWRTCGSTASGVEALEAHVAGDDPAYGTGMTSGSASTSEVTDARLPVLQRSTRCARQVPGRSPARTARRACRAPSQITTSMTTRTSANPAMDAHGNGMSPACTLA